MKWGYYYIPEECAKPGSNCPFQLILHGCGMAPFDNIPEFAPFAAQNGMVMAFP